jgi:hypothetical protein
MQARRIIRDRIVRVQAGGRDAGSATPPNRSNPLDGGAEADTLVTPTPRSVRES